MFSGVGGMHAATLFVLLATIDVGQVAEGQNRVVIAVNTALDGKGEVLRDTRIVVSGSKIVAIDPKASPIDYDLRGLTVMPGWIDSHVHITSSFGPDGKNAGMGDATPEAAYRAAANAYATLLAGFTTIQSMDNVVALREASARGGLPAPRILSITEPLVGRGEQTGTPEEVRAFVRKQKDAGADFVKIYASGGMRQTSQTIPQQDLDAACDEARKLGLRTLVHANYDAVHGAIAAGCTQVEHGLGATDADLHAMAEKGIYFDPQAGQLIQNYLDNRARYAGTPFFPKTAHPACPPDSRPEDGLWYRRARWHARSQRRRPYQPSARGWHRANGRSGFGELPGRRSDENGRPDRHPSAWTRS